jgi:hypothetical protein
MHDASFAYTCAAADCKRKTTAGQKHRVHHKKGARWRRAGKLYISQNGREEGGSREAVKAKQRAWDSASTAGFQRLVTEF